MSLSSKDVTPCRAFGRRLLGRAVLVVAIGCSGPDPGPSLPTSLVFVGGQNQTGAVGAPLLGKVIVEARNSSGPMSGVTIAVGTEAADGGSVSPQSAVTASDGSAQFTWTLGAKVGVQTLHASSVGATPISNTLIATATAGPATSIAPNSETFQIAVVGQPVNSRPSVTVTDAFGNVLSGVTVIFEIVQGVSQISGVQQTTDAAGHATIGGWTLGQDAFNYTIRARIPNGSVTVFEARSTPAAMTLVEGASQNANVGTAVTQLPAVRATRGDGSPLPNVPVNFSVVVGTGSVTGGAAQTGSDGIARPSRWVVGTTPGLNRVEASTLGRPSISFDATGVVAPPSLVGPANLVNNLNGIFSNYMAAMPSVRVTDAFGNPVALVDVNFQINAGGGIIVGPAVQTNFDGRATLSSWRLGSTGAQEVIATVAGLPPVIFMANASTPPAGTFRIEVRYAPGTNPSTAQRAAFDAAAARWTQVILAGGVPYLIKPNEMVTACGSVSGTVDGVVINAVLEFIDGPGRVLGSAGPCVLRDDGLLPVFGLMRFDTADLSVLETDGRLNAVILHEMAHVLGFGTIWQYTIPGGPFLQGAPGGDPSFSGAGARSAFYGAVAPGPPFAGVAVPVEAGGGSGTAYSHWRESIFTTELMTGFLSNPGVANPMSAVTIQHFRDLGYVVDDVSAEPFSFQVALQAASAWFAPQVGSLQLIEAPIPGPMIVINRRGDVVRRIPRM